MVADASTAPTVCCANAKNYTPVQRNRQMGKQDCRDGLEGIDHHVDRPGNRWANSVNLSSAVTATEEQTMPVVAGVDLGGTAINYTLVNGDEQFLIEGLCEHPALAKQGPDICLQQIA